MKMIRMNCPEHPEAVLDGYLLDCGITLGQYTARPAVVVCPGGGYLYCSPREGEPVALSYAARGLHAFVLTYSTGRDAAGFSPLQEISWAIGVIRENAQQWNIDPDKIVVCGFSAGGHLALASGLMAENKPNAMILGYPAVTIPNYPGADFMLKLLSGKETVTDADAQAYSLLDKITADAPPVFMVATAEDMLTSYGALPVAQKYNQLGKRYELHVFEYGPHGYSLASESTSDGSLQVMDSAFSQWQALSVEWIHKTFGKLEFVDKNTSKMRKYLQQLEMDLPGAKGGEFA